MRGVIIFTTLAMVVAVLPVFFLEGLSGAFFQPLVLSYALAVLASMLVALTVTPALSAILLSNAPLDESLRLTVGMRRSRRTPRRRCYWSG